MSSTFGRCWTEHPNYDVIEVPETPSPTPLARRRSERAQPPAPASTPAPPPPAHQPQPLPAPRPSHNQSEMALNVSLAGPAAATQQPHLRQHQSPNPLVGPRDGGEAHLYSLYVRISHLEAENKMLRSKLAAPSVGPGPAGEARQLAELERDAALAALAAEKERAAVLERRVVAAEGALRASSSRRHPDSQTSAPSAVSAVLRQPSAKVFQREDLRNTGTPREEVPTHHHHHHPAVPVSAPPARSLFLREAPVNMQDDARTAGKRRQHVGADRDASRELSVSFSGASPPRDADADSCSGPWSVDWNNMQQLVERSRRLRQNFDPKCATEPYMDC